MSLRITFGVTVALLLGFIWGLMEILFDYLADDPGPLGPRWGHERVS